MIKRHASPKSCLSGFICKTLYTIAKICRQGSLQYDAIVSFYGMNYYYDYGVAKKGKRDLCLVA